LQVKNVSSVGMIVPTVGTFISKPFYNFIFANKKYECIQTSTFHIILQPKKIQHHNAPKKDNNKKRHMQYERSNNI
jgi:hypothetical protein